MTDTAPKRAMADLDKVAEAICGVTSAGKLFPWPTLTESERDAWRMMAIAAMDALGLTEETCTYPEFETKREAGGEGVFAYAGQTSRYIGMRTDRRLVSPWQQVSTQPHPVEVCEVDDDEYALRNAAG